MLDLGLRQSWLLLNNLRKMKEFCLLDTSQQSDLLFLLTQHQLLKNRISTSNIHARCSPPTNEQPEDPATNFPALHRHYQQFKAQLQATANFKLSKMHKLKYSKKFYKLLKRNFMHSESPRLPNHIRLTKTSPLSSTHEEEANTWAQHYQTVSTEYGTQNAHFDATFFTHLESLMSKFFAKQDFHECRSKQFFSLREIEKVVAKLDVTKSPGIDNFGAMFWVRGGRGSVAILHLLLNHFMQTGFIPSDLKMALITSIFKHGGASESLVNAYRPISVLNTILKIFEMLLLPKLTSDSQTELHECQSGFRDFRSTYDNLVPLESLVQHHKEHSKPLFFAFLDISKAFDKAWRSGILYRLLQAKTRPEYLRILRELHTNTISIAKTSQGLTPQFSTTAGVRQGSILSPWLFNALITPLLTLLESTPGVLVSKRIFHGFLFCDDLLLVAPTHEALQRKLLICAQFGFKWRFRFNPDKTQIFGLNITRKDRRTPFMLNAQSIKIQKKQAKYLGLPFKETGIQWKFYFNSVLERFWKKVFQLKRLFSSRFTLTPRTISNLYKSLCLSLLVYGLALVPQNQHIMIQPNKNLPPTNSHLIAWLNKNHEQALQQLFMARPSTKTNSVRLLLGIPSIFYFHHKFQCQLLHKYANLDHPAATLVQQSLASPTQMISSLSQPISYYLQNVFPERVFTFLASPIFPNFLQSYLEMWDQKLSRQENKGRKTNQSSLIQCFGFLSTKLSFFRFSPLDTLRSTAQIRMWFQAVSQCNFVHPFKFSLSIPCQFCDFQSLSLHHLAIQCPYFSNKRDRFIVSCLNQSLTNLLHLIFVHAQHEKLDLLKKPSLVSNNSKIFNHARIS